MIYFEIVSNLEGVKIKTIQLYNNFQFDLIRYQEGTRVSYFKVGR